VNRRATVPDRILHFAQSRPDAPFCTFLSGDRVERISFAQLLSRSSAYARRYQASGLVPGDLVIIVLEHTPHLFYSYVGAILAGAIPSFMPFPSPKQRADLYWADHDALFARIDPRLLVTYEGNLAAAKAALPGFSIPTVIADDAILATAGDANEIAAKPDDVACLQHSSGTTSLKKGVMLTHREILSEVDAYARALRFTQDDSIASWLPLYHDMGFIACFMSSMLLGTHLVALDPFEWVMRPTLLLDAIERYRTTFTWLPNFAFSHIVNAARRTASWDLSSTRAFINCSEPCKATTFDRFFERFRDCGVTREKLQVCYAMAENVFAVTQTPLDRIARTVEADAETYARGRLLPRDEHSAGLSIVSCGPPLEGVRIEVRDDRDAPLADATIGEICVSSPFLFGGYYNLPETTAARLRDGWYHTGDMGFLQAGELYVTGRSDDMLIVNGRNYYAHEIESIVNAVPGAIPGRNVAIGADDRLTDATVVVVLTECAPEFDVVAVGHDIRARVLETLGLAIHSVVPLNRGQMIKTTSGKISRVQNKELYDKGIFTASGG
jgi:acyl-CoA synthetase (AMP-forming)/AMP-acid ligase II